MSLYICNNKVAHFPELCKRASQPWGCAVLILWFSHSVRTQVPSLQVSGSTWNNVRCLLVSSKTKNKCLWSLHFEKLISNLLVFKERLERSLVSRGMISMRCMCCIFLRTHLPKQEVRAVCPGWARSPGSDSASGWAFLAPNRGWKWLFNKRHVDAL